IELARFNYVKGGNTSFVCYPPHELTIHIAQLDATDDLHEKHTGALLSPPSTDGLDYFPPLVPPTFPVDPPKMDLVFSGFGW
ncbi:ribosome biogenesis GTPase YqeH, partial [Bacillus pumilus]